MSTLDEAREQPGTSKPLAGGWKHSSPGRRKLTFLKARTLDTWEEETLNYHRAGAANGPTLAVNLIIEETRRLGHGFRNWDNYRLRLLLHCSIIWYTPPTKRIRGGKPPLAA